MIELNEIKKIVVSRTDKIGDLVLSIPSFYMLKKLYPKAELTVLVRKYNYDIVKNLSYIDRVIKVDEYDEKELSEIIKSIGADIFIALYVDKLVLKLAKDSKAPIRIGPLSKIKSFFVFNRGVYQKRSKSLKNEAEYNLDLIRKLDKNRFDKYFEIENRICLKEENRKKAEKFYQDNRIRAEKTLVINPFMGGSAKNITDEQYAELINRLLKKKDMDIVITAHISDRERAEKLLSMIDGNSVYLYINEGSILDMAGVIERAKLYFGGSTGPTHIAAALGKTVVAIYPNKPTQHPKRWGVYPKRDVTYIIPDENQKDEDYSTKIFTTYTDEIRERIVDKIIENMERDI